MVLHVPFSPSSPGILRTVLWESGGHGNPATVILKFWVVLAPVGDRWRTALRTHSHWRKRLSGPQLGL